MVSKINSQALIEELRKKDLLNGMSTAPGRVRTFLLNPERRTTPHSCSLRVYDNNLGNFIELISQDLRGGSGVKVILDMYVQVSGRKDKIPDLKFYLDKEHKDYDKLEGSRYEEDYIEESEINDTDIIIRVADSMDVDEEDKSSIERSWKELIDICKEKNSKERIVIDLSSLRPSGSTNAIGLTSTGPIGLGKEEEDESKSDRDISSFTDIYKAIYGYIKEGSLFSFLYLLGTINATIRRGGSYKNGIVTSSMIYDNPNIDEYLDVPINKLPGSHKKGICLRASAILNRQLIDKVVDLVNSESLFLSKEKEVDKDKNPFTKPYYNVCMGIKLSDKDTCLIYRNNLYKCELPENIVDGYVEVTQDIIKLHVAWRDVCNLDRVGRIYLPLEKSRQVAIDTMGVANALHKWGVSYKEFVPALESIVQYRSPIQFDTGVKAIDLGIERDIVFRIVKSIARGYQESTRVADEMMESFGLPKLERLHTIEPAQSHAYQIPGEYTTCRGIWPPSFTRVRRLSDTQQNKIYYHGPVETMIDIGTSLYERLCIAWQKVMNIYGGRPHGISYDLYTVASVDWLIKSFMNTPLETKYYTLPDQIGLLKVSLSDEDTNEEDIVATVGTKEECPVCAE